MPQKSTKTELYNYAKSLSQYSIEYLLFHVINFFFDYQISFHKYFTKNLLRNYSLY